MAVAMSTLAARLEPIATVTANGSHRCGRRGSSGFAVHKKSANAAPGPASKNGPTTASLNQPGPANDSGTAATAHTVTTAVVRPAGPIAALTIGSSFRTRHPLNVKDNPVAILCDHGPSGSCPAGGHEVLDSIRWADPEQPGCRLLTFCHNEIAALRG